MIWFSGEVCMPEISLTDWVDFVISAGPTRFRKVKELATRDDYDPRFDFWKPLREGLQNHHQGKTTLEQIVVALKDPKKVNRYPEVIKAYRKFLGNKHLAWFRPPSAGRTYAGLTVRINPELGLHFEGKKHVVKLYFKEEKPTKQRLSVVLAMMSLALNLGDGMVPAVLDVNSSRMILAKATDLDLLPMLQAEAIAFVHMWNAVSPAALGMSASVTS
jgi:hypothetical protein